MDDLHTKILTQEMDFMCQTTQNFDMLCNKLIAKGIITVQEHDALKLLATKELRCRDLFTSLITKPGNNFQKFVQALEESVNDDVGDRLLKVESTLRKAGA